MFWTRRVLAADVELFGVFDDDLSALRTSHESRPLEGAKVLDVVVDDVQAGGGRLQPAETDVAADVLALVVVLDGGLEENPWRERVRPFECHERGDKVPLLQIHVEVTDTERRGELVLVTVVDRGGSSDTPSEKKPPASIVLSSDNMALLSVLARNPQLKLS